MAVHSKTPTAGKRTGRNRVASRMDPPGWRLSTEQAMFIAYYFGESKHNPVDAAIRLGYPNPLKRGFELMRNPAVKAAIAAKLDQHCMSVQEALVRQTEVARVDMDDFFTLKNGRLCFDYAKALKRGKTHLIKKIRFTTNGVECELHDAMAAQDRILNYHGAFNHTQNHEHHHSIDWMKVPQELLDRFIRREITIDYILRVAPQAIIDGDGLVHEAESLSAPDGEESSPGPENGPSMIFGGDPSGEDSGS